MKLSRRAFLKATALTLGGLSLLKVSSISAAKQVYPVPPTVMLHTADRRQLLKLLLWLNEQQYTSIGYTDLMNAMQGKASLPAKPVLITIDDIASNYIQPYFLDMAKMVEDAGHRGVFGVVTRESPARSPKVWAQLADLAEHGWEMDSHTKTHSLFSSLSIDDLRDEIVGSAEWLKDGIGRTPLSLIAPYGGVYSTGRNFDPRVFDLAREAGYQFVVGIVGGRDITSMDQPPYYVGRVGTGVDHVQTAYWITHFREG